MRVVWKWPVTPDDTFVVEMPSGPIVHVGDDASSPLGVSMWAEVERDAVRRRREFSAIPTGLPVPSLASYCGTFHRNAGGMRLVFHLYELE